jgi:hypothetical protein
MSKSKSTSSLKQSALQPIMLTKEQYLVLAKTVYMGNWMANANRGGLGDEPLRTEYEEIADLIFSQASAFGFPKTFEHDLEFDEEYQNTHESMSPLSEMIDEYNTENMWDELVSELAGRDMAEANPFEDVINMSDEQRYMTRMKYVDTWDDEFTEYGVQRLVVDTTREVEEEEGEMGENNIKRI